MFIKKNAIIVLCVLVMFWSARPLDACYGVLVGKKASEDGSVIFGHVEQNDGERIINFRKIPRMKFETGTLVKLKNGGTLPQVKETYSFLWSENPGLSFSDAYFNEWGVAVGSDGCPSREASYEKLVERGDIVDGGIGYMLRRLIAQRSKTARSGVELAGRLVEQFGYSDPGRTLIIADPNEAWILALIRGKRWVARRVGDHEVVLVPNVYVIDEINLADSKNFLGSSDLVEYAKQMGWYNPASGKPFSFRKAYGPAGQGDCDPRQWRGQCIVLDKDLATNEPLPFAVKPGRKFAVKDVIRILRDHGRDGKGQICNTAVQEASVFQLRSGMPQEIGCIYWRTSGAPCTAALVPWYLGISQTPANFYKPVAIERQLALEHHFNPPKGTFEFDPELSWWTFMTLQDLVHKDYKNNLLKARRVWDDFEAKEFAKQAEFEENILNKYSSDPDTARKLLTEYSHQMAQRTLTLATELIKELGGKK
ncbi:dipeptidase [Planctomycetota bacterium]